MKHNEPNSAIGLDDVTARVAKARDNPLAGHGGQEGNKNAIKEKVQAAKLNPLTDAGMKNEVDNVNIKTKGGNDTDYTLRRLARDKPQLLDAVEVIAVLVVSARSKVSSCDFGLVVEITTDFNSVVGRKTS